MQDPFHIPPEDWQDLKVRVRDIHDALLGTIDGRIQGIKQVIVDHERRLTALEDSRKWTMRTLTDKLIAAIIGFVVAYIGTHGGHK
jgi:hypothetical protein